ncbi:MAG: heavy metal-binding domain-containing protein [Planctomycetota bacterium]
MDADTIGDIIGLAITAGILFTGLFAGRILERRHVRLLREHEEQFRWMHTSNVRAIPSRAKDPQMVVGHVVISTDYFKTFIARLKKLIGGELGTYQTLLMRARREALKRVQEEAAERGLNSVANVRIEYAAVGGMGSGNQKGVISVAVLASGTGYQDPELARPDQQLASG